MGAPAQELRAGAGVPVPGERVELHGRRRQGQAHGEVHQAQARRRWQLIWPAHMHACCWLRIKIDRKSPAAFVPRVDCLQLL